MLGLHSRHSSARHVGTCRPVLRWQLQLLGAGSAFSVWVAPLVCLALAPFVFPSAACWTATPGLLGIHVACIQTHYWLLVCLSLRVVTFTCFIALVLSPGDRRCDGHSRFGIADLVALCVPFSSCAMTCEASATRVLQGVSRLGVSLVQHLLLDSLSAWLVPCLVMDSLGGWCFSRLDLRVHLGRMDSCILVSCVEALCTRLVHFVVSTTRFLVCKAFASSSSS